MRRVRTSNNRQVGFAYTPSQAEVNELMALGRPEVQAKELQRYTVVPEGVDLPDSVATYALHLYSSQIEEVPGQPLPEVPVGVMDTGYVTAGSAVELTVVDSGGAEVVGETPPAPAESPLSVWVACEDCGETLTAKTLSAAKSKLRAHNRKDHSA